MNNIVKILGYSGGITTSLILLMIIFFSSFNNYRIIIMTNSFNEYWLELISLLVFIVCLFFMFLNETWFYREKRR
jgi:hypothetical protein